MHKLRMLQMKLAKRTTTNSAVQTAISGAQSRDFNAYVVRMRAEASTHQTQPSPSSFASAVEASPLAEPAAPKPLAVEQSAPTAAPVQQTLEASPAEDALAGLRNKDLTAFSDEQLRTVCTAKGYDFAAVASLRADQQLLKDFDEA